MLITVANVETKTSQKGTAYHLIYDDTGVKRLSFAAPPGPGMTIEAEVVPTRDGTGEFIKSWKPTAAATPPTATTFVPKSGGMSKDEWNERERTTRQSIHRQKASDVGTQLLIAGIITVGCLRNWIPWYCNYYETGQLGPSPATGLEAPTPTEVPKDIPKEVKAAPEASCAVAGPVAVPSLKGWPDLMYRCGRNDITPTNACKLLGVVNVKELPADMTPDKAWLVIAEKSGKKELKP